MINHPQCTLEIYLDGRWQAAATLELLGEQGSGTDAATRTTYLVEYALDHLDRHDAAALSATLPVTFDLIRSKAWPAIMVDLLPQGYGRQELAKRLGVPAHSKNSDWPLLLAGAGNPIGNLRIAEASVYAKAQIGASRGFTRDEIVSRAEAFMEFLANEGYFVAGSSGVQGEWPKILLTQDKTGLWHLDHLLPDSEAVKHWIVKFARSDNKLFGMILEAEAAYHGLAAELGLRVTEALVHENGVLFIPRFDRIASQGRVSRIAQESLYSLAGKSGFEATLTHNQACSEISAYCTDPAADITEYVLRDVLNVVLGNKDNHGRNTAFQRFENGRVALSPLFDFAPMFLHPDGIARRIRWERDDGGAPAWGSVAEQAALAGGIDAKALRQRLANFTDSIAGLPERMVKSRVSQDIISRLYPGIMANAERLRDALPR